MVPWRIPRMTSVPPHRAIRARRDGRRAAGSSAIASGPTARWVAPVCCSGGSTRRGAWATAQSNPLRLTPGFAAHALHLLGDIATHPDRFDAERGEAHYRKALALAEPRGMRPLVAHCHFGLGKLYRRTSKREQATEHLITAMTMYREMDMRFWLEQAEAELREMA